MGASTFEEMGIPQSTVPEPSCLSFRHGRKKAENKGKGKMAAPLDPAVPPADGGGRAYSPPDYERMPVGARSFHEAHRDTFHVLTLTDGCTLRVDASYLPLKPNALDAGGRGHCSCEDDAQGFVAAYLLHWPAFAATHLSPGAWTLLEAKNFAGHLLETWDLDTRRLYSGPGLRPATMDAAAAALAGGIAGIAKRQRDWEAQRFEDAEEIERRRAAEAKAATETKASTNLDTASTKATAAVRKTAKARRWPWAWW